MNISDARGYPRGPPAFPRIFREIMQRRFTQNCFRTSLSLRHPPQFGPNIRLLNFHRFDRSSLEIVENSELVIVVVVWNFRVVSRNVATPSDSPCLLGVNRRSFGDSCERFETTIRKVAPTSDKPRTRYRTVAEVPGFVGRFCGTLLRSLARSTIFSSTTTTASREYERMRAMCVCVYACKREGEIKREREKRERAKRRRSTKERGSGGISTGLYPERVFS